MSVASHIAHLVGSGPRETFGERCVRIADVMQTYDTELMLKKGIFANESELERFEMVVRAKRHPEMASLLLDKAGIDPALAQLISRDNRSIWLSAVLDAVRYIKEAKYVTQLEKCLDSYELLLGLLLPRGDNHELHFLLRQELAKDNQELAESTTEVKENLFHLKFKD